jgi:molecular chaperone HtpG
MTDTPPTPTKSTPLAFKAETRQLLEILIHSLYTEREIFLRELISNASDALTRMAFEMLTNRDVLDPEVPLEVHITSDPEKRRLTIRDNGIGMNELEMVENLGTIARSGARAFMEAAQEANQTAPKPGEGSETGPAKNLSDIIGQFGVGFYSAFMVAEWIRVTSRSYQAQAAAASWYSTGENTFSIEPAEMAERGTVVEIQLKEDAAEFTDLNRLRQIIHKHSDFIGYPIYLGEESEQANRQSAIWRQYPRQVEEKEYEDFYRQLTLDSEGPVAHAHLVVDAPVQVYAVLFVPSNTERTMFSPRRETGLKLYARKILIQDYCKDLLPEYFSFVQGVVDSEDLPLNISRETVQSSRFMTQIKKLVTAKVVESLKALAKDKPDAYAVFWKNFGHFIKEGVAIEPVDPESLYPLLRFHTTLHPQEWASLDDVSGRVKAGQNKLYYIMGEDERSITYNPHLDLFRKQNVEVLILTDPMDSFMLLRLTKYKDFELVNAAAADAELPKSDESIPEAEQTPDMNATDLSMLIEKFKSVLGDRVTDVRSTTHLLDSPACLVDPDGVPGQPLQRVYKLLGKEYESPKKVLEINSRHPILTRLSSLPADDPRPAMVIEQLYEDALLVEGLHPDPASMIGRIQSLIEKALA